MLSKRVLNALMLSVAAVTLSAAAGATSATRLLPMGGSIRPFTGNIEPLTGNIEPLTGNIEPLTGNIEPLTGNIEPLTGNIEPLTGNIEPLYGNIAALTGNIEPLTGNIEPLTGNIEPLTGNIEPLTGNIEPLYGKINPLSGTIQLLTGNIEPLTGNIEPLTGNIEQLTGNIEPLTGNIEPLTGNIEPLTGNIEPLTGNIEPLTGNIEPLTGNIEPLTGNIEPFYGSFQPFYGNIKSLTGNIEPLTGNIEPLTGNIEPLAGIINQFWGSIEPLTGNIEPLTGNIEPLNAYVEPFFLNIEPLWRGALGPTWASAVQPGSTVNLSKVLNDLRVFVAVSAIDYGRAFHNATGNNFLDGFADPMLAKFGINLNDASSLANLSVGAQNTFILNWYDGLMAYSALPRVDWWMNAVHWAPVLTQDNNLGTHTVVGILDSKFNDVSTNVKNLTFVGGYDYYVNDHGAMVASLIASQPAAGKVMGIAPNSPVVAYNPFDYTGTTNWEDVTAGINALYAHGATVINASMGVPGSVLTDDWAQVMTSAQINQTGHNFVLVKAAGNEGVTQTTDVNWIGSAAPNNLILVGSVDMSGHISSFSNTPGNACILVNDVCNEQNKLMYHFVVAPGENILVSSNAGGVTRASGTSFAAPLVTGAVALIQDRWPWLQQHPTETTDVIFWSAKDLGAPGVDPVYGWGELDVAAALSPLNFNNLKVLMPGVTDYSKAVSAGTLKSAMLNPGQMALWNRKGAYIVAFETIGSTFRDFDIPLSQMLVGQKMPDGTGDPFQSYLYKRLIDWARTPSAFGFNAVTSKAVKGDWNLSLTTTETTPDEKRINSAPLHYEFAATNAKTGLGFRFGEGTGAHALMGMEGFSQRADFDPATGGVNPVLGFASGGAYGQADMTFGKFRFSFGFTQKSDNHEALDPTYGPVALSPFATNKAQASVMGVDYQVMDGLTVKASYTNLRENNGMFGAQGSGLFDMERGSSTAATTLSASYVLPQGWSLLGSATMARSAAPSFSSAALSFNGSNLTSTAYEFVADKQGLFEKKDHIRLSVAQPLHLEGASLTYNSVQVVNRQTGELGTFSQSWDASGKRELRMEALYGTPIMDGTGELDAYSLVDLNPHTSRTGATELAIGSRIRFDF